MTGEALRTISILKNKADGERGVGSHRRSVRSSKVYVERERDAVHDDHGREPFFTP